MIKSAIFVKKRLTFIIFKKWFYFTINYPSKRKGFMKTYENEEV